VLYDSGTTTSPNAKGKTMKVEDLILVSVDDHAIEPPNAFARHMPTRFKGREPHVVKKGDRDVWVFEEQATGYMGLNSVVGRPKEEYGMGPLGYDQMRRGTWNIKDRVDDMKRQWRARLIVLPHVSRLCRAALSGACRSRGIVGGYPGLQRLALT